MLFTISKEHLLKLFKLALFVIVDKKAMNNIVGSHVLLSVAQKKITLIATDLDIELIIEEDLSSIEYPGSIVVPFRKISEICRAMTADIALKIAISEFDQLKLTIQSQQGFFSINYLLPEVFPVLTEKEFTSNFLIKAGFLQEIISKVAFAMGDDESRHFLNGLLLHFSNDNIASVAADGHRLMIWEVKFPQNEELIKNLQDNLKILIPRKSIFDILKIIADINENEFINLSVGKFHFRININQLTYTSKLLNVEFPPYKRLIPVNTGNELTVNREQLKSCCLRAAALLGDKSQGVKLYFKSDKLIISGSNEQGDVVEDSIVAHLEGKELAIFFNLKYLLDFLSNSNVDNIIFKFENATTGVLLQDNQLHSSYILMPMQI